MAKHDVDSAATAKAQCILVRLALPPYTIHFKAPTYMKETTLELIDQRVCKEVLRTTASIPEVREGIGSDPKFWTDLVTLFKAAVTSLERRSFSIWDPTSVDYESTSGALIASHYPSLWKDLERLNNMVSIGRNVLTAGILVQDLAAETVIEHEIFRLINCAVRVTARGFDGEAGTGDEEKWQHVVNNYKKLLITSLQFLNNLVAQNERRKLMLWVNLFDSSNSDLGDVSIPANMHKKPEFPITKEHLLIAYGQYKDEVLNLDGAVRLYEDVPFAALPPQAVQGRQTSALNGYVFFAKSMLNLAIDDFHKMHGRTPTLAELHLDLPRRWAEQSDYHAHWQKRWETTQRKYQDDLAMYETRMALLSGRDGTSNGMLEENKITQLEKHLNDRYRSELPQVAPIEPIHRATGDEAATIDDEDMKMLFTADAGTKILESGKAELMKRLEGYAHTDEQEAFAYDNTQPQQSEEVWSVNSEERRDGSEPEDDYPGSTEDGRGLLTDVPLILGPSEIEVLPMIVMSGIVPPTNQLAQCKTQAERYALINMHTVRCHLLFAQDNGRNLLRELLIFVAAWDLREEELYFKFMVRCLEAILANGLMPYAYHAFRDRSRSKDIISPAQAVIMKLLTNIFRARSEANKLAQTPLRPHRVDVHILNFIFTEFRQHIVPQTCALIFLQGQIHMGRASPEDFPLNLWDMERMYEGVYQYLEFFAVLTEEGYWKNILGGWEIASELVTLLRELEGGIPKMQSERAPRAALPERTSSMNAVTQRASSADARLSQTTDVPGQQIFEADTPLAYPEDAQDEPSDFEWRNLKKLTVLVLSSLIWKNKMVQDQIRRYGGLEALVACCKHDEHNPYIREHAIMCLRFAVEDNTENATVIRKMAAQGEKKGRDDGKLEDEDVPREVLDANGYETFMDGKGQIGLRRKEPVNTQLPAVPTLASNQQTISVSGMAAARPVLPPLQSSKLTPEKAAELMQNALKELPLGMGASLAKGLEGLIKGEK